MPPLLIKTAKTFLKILWQIFFKSLLVPAYKLYLFLIKYIKKHLVQNPYLTPNQIKNTFRQNTPAHLVILIITVLVLINNLYTRDIYAEEFNKKSIVAQLLITDIEENIIETSPALTALKERPLTESISHNLSTLEAKKTILKNDSVNQPLSSSINPIALSQGGEALIKPNIAPFSQDDIPAPAPTPSVKSNQIEYYLVQSGDTISAIAEKFGISVNTILWENNLSLSSYIRPGDKLAILPVSGVSYTVRSGDTLSKIANEFGVAINEILSFNSFESASLLKINQKIIIPGGKLGLTQLSPTRSIYSKSTAPASTENFLWPTNSKRITQYYHWRHHAIDIGDKTGNPIYAARGGRIERAGWTTGYGYNVVINHGGGTKTLYAHMSKIYVVHGDQINQGEVIGAIGSTGWSTGPHLHLEIIINGIKVNPLSDL